MTIKNESHINFMVTYVDRDKCPACGGNADEYEWRTRGAQFSRTKCVCGAVWHGGTHKNWTRIKGDGRGCMCQVWKTNEVVTNP